MTGKALSRQIGGQHYKSMGIQPVELGYANRYDDCIFSSIKYVSRHGRKGKHLDLEKASHFVDLRLDMVAKYGLLSGVEALSIELYLSSNEITGLDAEIIRELHWWSCRLPTPKPSNAEIAESIKAKIALVAQTYYGDSND